MRASSRGSAAVRTPRVGARRGVEEDQAAAEGLVLSESLTQVFVSVPVCVYVCLYLYLCVCVCVCVCLSVRVYMCTYRRVG